MENMTMVLTYQTVAINIIELLGDIEEVHTLSENSNRQQLDRAGPIGFFLTEGQSLPCRRQRLCPPEALGVPSLHILASFEWEHRPETLVPIDRS